MGSSQIVSELSWIIRHPADVRELLGGVGQNSSSHILKLEDQNHFNNSAKISGIFRTHPLIWVISYLVPHFPAINFDT